MNKRQITWWELFEQVEERIREEPQNYCQLRYVLPPENRHERERFGMPTERCGTAYCIAGWAGVEAGVPHSVITNQLSALVGYVAVHNLFSGGALMRYFGGDIIGPVGTTQYAEAGITHLRKFMREYERVLRENNAPVNSNRT